MRVEAECITSGLVPFNPEDEYCVTPNGDVYLKCGGPASEGVDGSCSLFEGHGSVADQACPIEQTGVPSQRTLVTAAAASPCRSYRSQARLLRMVQEKESFLPWSTKTQRMKTRQASRQGCLTSSSPTAPDIIGSPDAVTVEAEKITSTRQRAGATSAKTTSALPQKKHVQDPARMKPRGMKQSAMLPPGSMKNKEPVQLKEAALEANSGDTPLCRGDIATNEAADGVQSSAAVSPPESTHPSSEDAGDREVQETSVQIPVQSFEEGQGRSNHASRDIVVHNRQGVLELSPLREMDRYTSTVKERKRKNATSESEESAGYDHRRRHGRLRHRRWSYSRSESDTSEVEYRQRRVHGRQKQRRSPRREGKGRSYSPEIHHRRRGQKNASHRHHRDFEQSYSSGSSTDSRRRRKRHSPHAEYGRRTHTRAPSPPDKYPSSPSRHRDFRKTHSVHEWERRTAGSLNPPSSDTESGQEPIRIEEMTEAAKRRDRRVRKADMDRMTAQRERKGLKPWTLSVTPGGVPYGPGVRHWREEIRKLAAVHLDPSCTHIKMQESADMATFREALELNIEYTRPPLDSIIQTLAGRAVAVRRNWLLQKISNGEEMPVGVTEDHWHQLVMLQASPSHAIRSENARRANAARITLGRTGPKGVVGVTEDLRKRLGRDPDPDEVETEMQRDKGYGGKKRRVQEEGKQGFRKAVQDSDSNEDLSDYDGEDHCTEHMAASTARCVTPGTSLTPAMEQNMFDPEYVASMQKELAELKAFKEAMVARMNGGGEKGVHVGHRRRQKEKEVHTVQTAEHTGRLTSVSGKKKDPHDQYFKHLVSRYEEVQSFMPTELQGVVGRCVAELNTGYIRNDRDTLGKDLSVGNDDVLDSGNACNPVQGKGRMQAKPKKTRVT